MSSDVGSVQRQSQAAAVVSPLMEISSELPLGVGNTPSTVTSFEEVSESFFTRCYHVCKFLVNGFLNIFFSIFEVFECIWNFFTYCPVAAMKMRVFAMITDQLCVNELRSSMRDTSKLAMVIRIDDRIIEHHMVGNEAQLENFKEEIISRLEEIGSFGVNSASSLFVQTFLVNKEDRSLVTILKGVIGEEISEQTQVVNTPTGIPLNKFSVYLKDDLNLLYKGCEQECPLLQFFENLHTETNL